MGAKRPPAIKSKMYIEIDRSAYLEDGEIKLIGEPISAPEVVTKVPRGKFEIVYCSELFDIMRELGNKKIEILAYLLDNKDSNNSLNITNVELAEKTNASRTTVIETLKILSGAGLLTKKNSVIMMSPGLMIKGNQVREAFLMRRYVEMSEQSKPEMQMLESTIDAQYKLTESGDIVQEVH